MKREHTLRRRLHSLDTLTEAVSAMKSLSAHHLRTARAALPAAHAYREQVESALAVIDIPQPDDDSSSPAILLIAADLGLCNGYNSRLTEAALAQWRTLHPTQFYCVGRRPLSALARADVPVTHAYSSPTSVAGLSELLLDLSGDLMDEYLEQKYDSLHVVSARFEGVGEFAPIRTRILPITPPRSDSNAKPSRYVSDRRLASVAIREYLYITLFQTLLDSLASEHGTRLIATESAGEWLSSQAAVVRRQLAAIRREATTQEVLDIAFGAKRGQQH